MVIYLAPLDTEVQCPGCAWRGILREAVLPVNGAATCPWCEATVEAMPDPEIVIG